MQLPYLSTARVLARQATNFDICIVGCPPRIEKPSADYLTVVPAACLSIPVPRI